LKKLKTIFSIFFLFFVGCQVSSETLQVIRDHRVITEETVEVLTIDISSLPEDEQEQAQILMDRLIYMRDSAIFIDKYIMNKVSLEEYSKILRLKSALE